LKVILTALDEVQTPLVIFQFRV
jgi:hypothetical protein